VAERTPLSVSLASKESVCLPDTVAPAAAALASVPLTCPTVGGTLSASISVMSLSAGTCVLSLKLHVGDERSVEQVTYISKSRAPSGRVHCSGAV
jgi:hypothetical protein